MIIYYQMRTLKRHIISLIVPMALFIAAFVLADEAPPSDSSASVIVKPVFKIDLDKNNIDFGQVRPGESKNLGEGNYHNQVTCQSNNGRSWCLTISLPNFLTGAHKGEKIPISNFKYMPGWTNGTGTVDSQYAYKELSSENSQVYTSSVEDAMANLIDIQFQYSLSIPDNATADYYTTTVVYTMTEML